MKLELFPFQKKAVTELRQKSQLAQESNKSSNEPQVISFTAPTGAGKTIIMADLIEEIFFGNENFPEQQDAIFVWLSDSPQLNEQSRQKIDRYADKIRLDQCVMIEDESFDKERLEEGNIYFLNTQKMSSSGNLTKHSDNRQYTIWETLENTAKTENVKLYVIIDEAHRGMRGTAAGKATTIMQKFILGSERDGLNAMPVVIGMTATPERFNALIGASTSTVHKVVVTAAEVRASGLLKERIVISYPEDINAQNDLAILQAATDEWQNKVVHWYQYTHKYCHKNINPVFVIQVQPGLGDHISETNLDDCIAKIEERINYRFKVGEVVHAFGQTESITVNGLEVPRVNASEIEEDRNIKVVLFKESLSTGWDCPRAETMMSFSRVNDPTYIAQLLGRMIRTPMQRHINVDESLNDVYLFLPYFDRDNVKKIVDSLQDEEGGEIPTVIDDEVFNNPQYSTWTLRPTRRTKAPEPAAGQTSLFDDSGVSDSFISTLTNNIESNSNNLININYVSDSNPNPASQTVVINDSSLEGAEETLNQIHNALNEQLSLNIGINREEIVNFINEQDPPFITYDVKQTNINNYFVSMFKLARLLSQTNLSSEEIKTIRKDIIEIIKNYIDELHNTNQYDELAKNVLQFKIASQVFDTFGEELTNSNILNLFSTDSDLDRQLRNADNVLGREGLQNYYGREYQNEENPNEYKIDFILFIVNAENVKKIFNYAKDKFHELDDKYRRMINHLGDRERKLYNDTVAAADPVSKHAYNLPDRIVVRNDENGINYYNHLFVNEDGIAKIELNNWEKGVLEEEQIKNDFVCWFRNEPRKKWSLCICYEMNGVKKPMYPDMLIVRKDDNTNYVVDILEPHGQQFADNLAKAKGLADYAELCPSYGRIQMIRETTDASGRKKYKRLDFCKRDIREKVKASMTVDEFDHIFDQYGVIE